MWSRRDTTFDPVEKYVKDGLPNDHWFIEMLDKERGKKKTWYDFDEHEAKHEYDSYPSDVKKAARFRDGLVGDCWRCFDHPAWSTEYKKHSEIVFRHLRGPLDDELQDCADGKHILVGEGDDDSDNDDDYKEGEKEEDAEEEEDDNGNKGGVGVPRGICRCAEKELSLMLYHMGHCEGQQSQSLMRQKMSRLLQSEVDKLPPFWTKSHSSPQTQTKWLKALTVVLYSLRDQSMWCFNEVKFYGMEDLMYLHNMEPRIKQAMSHLIYDGVFDSKDMYKVLNMFMQDIEFIATEHNRALEQSQDSIYFHVDSTEAPYKTLFVGFLKKFKSVVLEYHTKFSNTSSPPTGSSLSSASSGAAGSGGSGRKRSVIMEGMGDEEGGSNATSSSSSSSLPATGAATLIPASKKQKQQPARPVRKRDPGEVVPPAWAQAVAQQQQGAGAREEKRIGGGGVTFTSDELSSFLDEYMAECVEAVRAVRYSSEKGMTLKSKEVTQEVPSFAAAYQIMRPVLEAAAEPERQLMKASTSKSITFELKNYPDIIANPNSKAGRELIIGCHHENEIHQLLPSFSAAGIVKMCVDTTGRVLAKGSGSRYLYAFTDVIVESAVVKVSETSKGGVKVILLSTILKARKPKTEYTDVRVEPHTDEVDPSKIESYLMHSQSDIPHHPAFWC